jgi:transposase InsO family protein
MARSWRRRKLNTHGEEGGRELAALRGGKKGADKLDWSAAMDAAFAGAKQSLLTATHPAHPTVGAELSVVVDASATHVGACLQQRLPGRKVWQPLGFFSKKLEEAQQKYSAFDRELFVCNAGIHHFRYMLDGRRFAIFTDLKPLTYALARVSELWTARQSRQLSYVAEYTSDIRHITGAANVVADTLSRPPWQTVAVPARKFSHVHVDLVGPLPASSEGHAYLLTIIDRSTRWFEAVPLRNKEASTCVDAFISGWVGHFGVPGTVTTDRGTQFTSALWSSTCTSLGIKHVLTTANHPKSNGMVERVHRQLKDALRARGVGLIFHGCCWAYVPHLRRILHCLQRSWLLGHHWFFLDSSCTCQILHVGTCLRLPRGRCPMRWRPTLPRLT